MKNGRSGRKIETFQFGSQKRQSPSTVRLSQGHTSSLVSHENPRKVKFRRRKIRSAHVTTMLASLLCDIAITLA